MQLTGIRAGAALLTSPLLLAALAAAPAPSAVAADPPTAYWIGTSKSLTGVPANSQGWPRIDSVPLGTKAVAGFWGGDYLLSPGQAAWFTATTPDGQVIMGNQPQTDNPIQPTADHLALTQYRPADSAAGSVRPITVPTDKGAWNPVSTIAALKAKGIGGADVEDVEAVPGREDRMVFTSATPDFEFKKEDGDYPILGFLARRADGTWTYAAGESKTTAQLAQSSPESCELRKEKYFCGGLTEIAALTPSNRLVVTTYAPLAKDGDRSGDILILNADGTVSGRINYPNVSRGGVDYDVRAREVKTDPTSTAGNERFTVLFDVFRTGNGNQAGFVVQEFVISSRWGTWRTTDAFRPRDTLPNSAGKVREAGAETVTYGPDGSLFVAQRTTDGTAGPTARYSRDALNRCRSDEAVWTKKFGTVCQPTETFPVVDPTQSLSLDYIPATQTRKGAVVNTTMAGTISVIRDEGTGKWSSGRTADLGMNGVRSANGTPTDQISVRKGTRAGGFYYLPVQTLETPGKATGDQGKCGWWQGAVSLCRPAQRHQWLIQVDLDQLLK